MARMSDIAAVTGGRLVGEDSEFLGATIDSRQCQAGGLFVALPGANVDGHDYIEAAAAAGAAGALVARQVDSTLPQVIVTDVLAALQLYATVHRQQFTGPVIGVTGTNGKTTTKEILAAVLGHAMGPDAAVLYTRGNLNNHIGVPLTLLSLEARHSAAVIEMGASAAGEIALLAAIARPNVGIVTMAGAGHLEGFGSVAGVAAAKGELFESLPASGVAIINADDEYAGLWKGLASDCQQITFGLRAADVSADAIRIDNQGQRFHLHAPLGESEVQLPLSGRHNVMNALAAAAAALAVGISVENIAAGLSRANAVGGRMQILSGPEGARIVDDSYNANPNSVKAALDWLAEQPGRHWFVLGEMAELGEEAVALHSKVGEWARATGVQRMLTLGKLTEEAVQSFGEGASRCESHAEAVSQLEKMLSAQNAEDVTVLVKGSRSMQMEKVVAELVQAAAAPSGFRADQAVNGS